MSLTRILVLIILCLFAALFLPKKKNRPKGPVFTFSKTALTLQLLLIGLFLTGTLARLGMPLADLIWWLVVAIGFWAGFKERRNHAAFGGLLIFLSSILSLFMLLLTFITSM